MVNVGFNSAAILGIILAVGGAGLYFLRTIRPELSRDYDIFFAALGVLCGFILLFQGWRLDPILLFGQVLLTGSAGFFAFEAIRLRGIATEQAKRNTPIEDYERPVSKVYRTQDAQLYDYDGLEPVDEPYEDRRRLRGTPGTRERRTERYEGEARPPRTRAANSEGYGSEARPTSARRRPPRTSSRPPEQTAYSWDAQLDSESDWEEKPSRSRRPASNYPPSPSPESSPKQRRRRPPQSQISSPRNGEVTPTDVDYQPIDQPGQETDSSEDFDY